jgi:hypothetical protein
MKFAPTRLDSNIPANGSTKSKAVQQSDWQEWSQIYREMSYWELQIDEVNDEGLRQTHFLRSAIAIRNLPTTWNATTVNGCKATTVRIWSFDIISQ